MTKLICFTTIACFFILKSNTDIIALDVEDLFVEKEFHRLFTYMLTFSSLGEIVMGVAVFFPLSRRFEREFGSQEYISYLIKSTTLATFVQCFFLTNEYLATGIYPIIGALLQLYTKYTPRLHPKFVSILGLDLSEKALTYVFAMQLMGSQSTRSFIPFAAGYLAGVLSTHTYSPMKGIHVHIPKMIYNMGHNIAKTIGLEDLAHSPSYISHTGRRGAGTDGGTARGIPTAMGFGGAEHMPPAVPGAQPIPEQRFEPVPISDPPSEEAIQTLTAMGFEMDAVVSALRQADNNVEHAANRLLSGS
jgi:membrane associated rhomboid family serine protease